MYSSVGQQGYAERWYVYVRICKYVCIPRLVPAGNRGVDLLSLSSEEVCKYVGWAKKRKKNPKIPGEASKQD